MALDFIAGCLGGCAGVLVGHPFDTIKVRLQTQDFRNPIYRGTLHCLSSTVKNESLRGLYKGMSSPMAGIAVVNAIVFGVYGNIQRRLPDPEAYSSHFFAGATAGFCQAFICSPMELVKTRIQLQKDANLYKSPLDCLVKVWKTEGMSGVFRGQAITVLREVPGFGSYFLSYELMTKASVKDAPPLSTWHMLLAGGMAGTFSWVMCYPIDVIKSRIQADGMDGVRRYSGAVDCFHKSVKAEGYGCLARGLTSTIVRSFPTNAACFTVVTWTLRLMKQDEASSYQVISDLNQVNVGHESIGNPMPLKVGVVVKGLETHQPGYFSHLLKLKHAFFTDMSSNCIVSTQANLAGSSHCEKSVIVSDYTQIVLGPNDKEAERLLDEPTEKSSSLTHFLEEIRSEEDLSLVPSESHGDATSSSNRASKISADIIM